MLCVPQMRRSDATCACSPDVPLVRSRCSVVGKSEDGRWGRDEEQARCLAVASERPGQMVISRALDVAGKMCQSRDEYDGN